MPRRVANRDESGDTRSLATRTRILNAAQRILVRGGAPALTLRGVAAAAKMSLGNLQYHYRSLDLLFAALLERVLEQGIARVSKLAGTGERPDAGDIIDLLLTDHDDPHLVRLFVEIWAAAARRPQLRRPLEKFYDEYARALATIGDGGPLAERRARVAIALLEGSSLFRSGLCGVRSAQVDGVTRQVLLELLI